MFESRYGPEMACAGRHLHVSPNRAVTHGLNLRSGAPAELTIPAAGCERGLVIEYARGSAGHPGIR